MTGNRGRRRAGTREEAGKVRVKQDGKIEWLKFGVDVEGE